MPAKTRLIRTIGAVLCLVGGSVLAAPEAVSRDGDPIGGLLVERGLAPSAPVAALSQRVRDAAAEVILSAMHFLGVPYRLGGVSGDTGFDCSGFTRHVFESAAGLLLPRSAEEQATRAGLQPVPRDELQPGDLVFFNTLRRTFSHVGIYVGANRFIHAPRAGSRVRVEDMSDVYWSRRFTGARRADFVNASTTPASLR